jgi:hypothetical protein
MDLFDIYGIKYNINLDRSVCNYYEKITEFIKNPQLYNDTDLIKILTLNYYNNGIYCSNLIISNDLLKNSNKFFFKDLNVINNIGLIKILQPKEFLNEINSYIYKIDEIISFIENKHEELLKLDNKILKILSSLRKSNYFDYLSHLIDLNNMRLMINRIFFEYYQDLINCSNRFKQIKYDYFITENNIKNLLVNYYKLREKVCIIFNEEFILLTNNNINKCNVKENNGSIKYDIFVNIIETRIENI